MPGTFIDVKLSDAVRHDRELGVKLEEVCPVSIFKAIDDGVEVVESQLDECVLCELCLDAAPPGGVTIEKLYDGTSLKR